jgi:hypothetical protein
LSYRPTTPKYGKTQFYREDSRLNAQSRYVCDLFPTPAALSIRTAASEITYDLVFHLYDDNEVAQLVREAEDACLNEMARIDTEIAKDRGTSYGPMWVQFKHDLEAAINANIFGEEFRLNGYLRLSSCQRGWRNTRKPREVEATAPLTAQELAVLKPAVLLASGSLPELAPPLRDKGYYATLLRRWCS